MDIISFYWQAVEILLFLNVIKQVGLAIFVKKQGKVYLDASTLSSSMREMSINNPSNSCKSKSQAFSKS